MALTPPAGGAQPVTAPPPGEPDSFPRALVGDGTPLLLCSALALAFAGGFGAFLSLSGTFLPHDIAYYYSGRVVELPSRTRRAEHGGNRGLGSGVGSDAGADGAAL
jgi:hypothetical protein